MQTTNSTEAERRTRDFLAKAEVQIIQERNLKGVAGERTQDKGTLNEHSLRQRNIEWMNEAKELRRQRDQLLAALKDCLTSRGAPAERSHENALRRLDAINQVARNAIASTEGGK